MRYNCWYYTLQLLVLCATTAGTMRYNCWYYTLQLLCYSCRSYAAAQILYIYIEAYDDAPGVLYTTKYRSNAHTQRDNSYLSIIYWRGSCFALGNLRLGPLHFSKYLGLVCLPSFNQDFILILILHWQLWKSNVLFLWKYNTYIFEIFVSKLP